MSEANQVRVILAPETVYGVAPTPPVTWESLRIVSESLSGTPVTVVSNELRIDRAISDQIKTNTESGGTIEFEMSHKSFDTLIAAVMAQSDWTVDTPIVGTDQLLTGTFLRSFTIIKSYLDLTQTHVRLRGQRIPGITLNVNVGEILTGAFTASGADVDPLDGTNPVDGTDTVSPVTTTDVLNASSDVTVLERNTVEMPFIVSNIVLTIENNPRPQNGIRFDTPQDVLFGRANISGSITALLDDDSFPLYTDSFNQTPFSVDFTLSDGTNDLRLYLPNLKSTGPAPPATGIDTDVEVNIDFNALFDVTEQSALVIERTQP